MCLMLYVVMIPKLGDKIISRQSWSCRMSNVLMSEGKICFFFSYFSTFKIYSSILHVSADYQFVVYNNYIPKSYLYMTVYWHNGYSMSPLTLPFKWLRKFLQNPVLFLCISLGVSTNVDLVKWSFLFFFFPVLIQRMAVRQAM